MKNSGAGLKNSKQSDKKSNAKFRHVPSATQLTNYKSQLIN